MHWRLKVLAKILLARLPFGYRFWERLRLFKHGGMDRPAYAFDVFRRHHDRLRPAPAGFVGLELGPGDSLFSALIASAHGASASYLVDMDDYAQRDVASYGRMAAFLRDKGLAADPGPCRDLDDILARSHARYLTGGLSSLREIPSESVDFVWSQAVLEHVRRRDFLPVMKELRRIQRPQGVGSHRVDLQDHIGGALNSLRFRDSVWESEFMSRSGFYTNRLRLGAMLDAFRSAGFSPEVVQVDRWDRVPTPRHRMRQPYRDLPDEELLVRGFDVVLR